MPKVVNRVMVNIKKRNGVKKQFSRQKSEESLMKTEEYLDKLRRLQVDMDTLQKITIR